RRKRLKSCLYRSVLGPGRRIISGFDRSNNSIANPSNRRRPVTPSRHGPGRWPTGWVSARGRVASHIMYRMSTPEMSDTTTHGIRVAAGAFYLPDESDPDERKFVFGYTIVIANVGDSAAQLLSRHWVIIDGVGR